MKLVRLLEYERLKRLLKEIQSPKLKKRKLPESQSKNYKIALYPFL